MMDQQSAIAVSARANILTMFCGQGVKLALLQCSELQCEAPQL